MIYLLIRVWLKPVYHPQYAWQSFLMTDNDRWLADSVLGKMAMAQQSCYAQHNGWLSSTIVQHFSIYRSIWSHLLAQLLTPINLLMHICRLLLELLYLPGFRLIAVQFNPFQSTWPKIQSHSILMAWIGLIAVTNDGFKLDCNLCIYALPTH